MIELPSAPAPNGMETSLIDYGLIQRGAASIRVDRPGSRFGVSFTFPPMLPAAARVFVARLLRAKREGLKIALPLLVEQGTPGLPVVDGAGQTGSALAVRGMVPGYQPLSGFWLTIIDADGSAYLHAVAADAQADVAGKAVLQIEPPLRAPFPDGAQIEMAAPFVTGFVQGDRWSFELPLHRLVAVNFEMEEFA